MFPCNSAARRSRRCSAISKLPLPWLKQRRAEQRRSGHGRRSSTVVRDDPAPETLRPPNTGTQALELNNLAVVDKKVCFGTVALDIPGEDLRIGRLEHHLVQVQAIDDSGNDVGAPGSHVVRAP